MPEEHEHHHGLAHGQHERADKKEQQTAMYWGLGIAAAGLVLGALYFFGGGSKKSSSQPTVVNASQPFIPNPQDVSIGTNAAPLYWPALPTSGTPTQPKHHDSGDSSKKKKTETHHSNKSNDHKGYGKSPTGSSHGHHVSGHSTTHPKEKSHA